MGEAYRVLRSREDLPAVPVVMMCAGVQPTKLDPSITAFLRKPFNVAQLVELVVYLIRHPHSNGCT